MLKSSVRIPLGRYLRTYHLAHKALDPALISAIFRPFSQECNVLCCVIHYGRELSLLHRSLLRHDFQVHTA